MKLTGLSRSYDKRLDDLTLVSWSAGKSIIWDVTVVDTLAASYIKTTSKTAGRAAEIAVARKEEKYAALLINYDLIVIALETLGPLSYKTYTFLRELGRCLLLKIPTKHLSHFTKYPLPCNDSMPFVFVIAFQFR